MEAEPPPSDEWVTVAKLGRTWGRRGELSAIALSSKAERFESLQKVYLFGSAGDVLSEAEVESVWEHRGGLIFKFRGVDSISEAEALQGAEVRIPASERFVLPEDEYYHSDLIGCEVVDRKSGERLGQVSDVQDFGGPGVLQVTTDRPGGEILIPFARSICVEIDVAGRRIVVDLPEGLKEVNVR